MRGMGCASFTVAALSCLKSTQNRRLPSFFFTMTTGEAQGLLEGWMTPLDNICWTWAISSRRTVGFWRRYGWRNGGPSVSMVCCRSGVQPRSSSPWVTMSLNSWKRAFSCCCLGGRQVCGDRRRATRAGGGWWRRQRRRRFLTCPQFFRYASGAVLGGDCGSRLTLRIHW